MAHAPVLVAERGDKRLDSRRSDLCQRAYDCQPHLSILVGQRGDEGSYGRGADLHARLPLLLHRPEGRSRLILAWLPAQFLQGLGGGTAHARVRVAERSGERLYRRCANPRQRLDSGPSQVVVLIPQQRSQRLHRPPVANLAQGLNSSLPHGLALVAQDGDQGPHSPFAPDLTQHRSSGCAHTLIALVQDSDEGLHGRYANLGGLIPLALGHPVGCPFLVLARLPAKILNGLGRCLTHRGVLRIGQRPDQPFDVARCLQALDVRRSKRAHLTSPSAVGSC